MLSKTTHGVRVTLEPKFVAENSAPDEGRYVWTYMAEIANMGPRTARLIGWHCTVTDAAGATAVVPGPAIGATEPLLRPGQAFYYAADCELATPSGMLAGAYRLVDDDGAAFQVALPAVPLVSPLGKPMPS
jgi:ApaG protein